jgi:hypothetical protein
MIMLDYIDFCIAYICLHHFATARNIKTLDAVLKLLKLKLQHGILELSFNFHQSRRYHDPFDDLF